MPLRAALPAPLGAQPRGQQRGEARLPVAHGLVAEDEAALQEHLGQVAQAQLVAQPPQHDEQDEIGRVLQVIVGRAGALVEDPAAAAAAEGAIAERGAPRLLGGRGRGTVGAGHGHLLHATANAATLPERALPDNPCLNSDASLQRRADRVTAPYRGR